MFHLIFMKPIVESKAEVPSIRMEMPPRLRPCMNRKMAHVIIVITGSDKMKQMMPMM